MKTANYSTAIRNSEQGKYYFTSDIKEGINEIRFRKVVANKLIWVRGYIKIINMNK